MNIKGEAEESENDSPVFVPFWRREKGGEAC